MAKTIDIRLRSLFDGQGAAAAAKALQGLARAAQQANAAASAQSKLAAAESRNAAAAAQAAAANQRLATEQQRTATASSQAATAAQRLATEQQRTAKEAANAARAQTQAEAAAQRLAAASDRAAAAAARQNSAMTPLPRTLAGLSGAAAQVGSAVAGAFAFQQIAQFTTAAIGSANALEDAKTSLAQIAGSTELYNKTLSIAAQQQRLFGGSLASNVEDLSAFIISSRTTGVEMEKLISVAQRLAALDPGQGIAGANVALRELLSGNEKSLAMRFELPAAALKALGDEGLTATQRVEALSAFLDSVGLTAEATGAKLNNTSQSYRDLSAAGDALTTSLGALAAQGFAPAASAAADFANWLANSLDQITNYGERMQELGANIVQSSESYPEYVARVQELNDALPPFVERMEKVSPAAFDAAKGAQQAGIAVEEFQAATEGVDAQWTAALDTAAKQGPEAAAALQSLGGAVFEVAAGSEAGRAAVEQLAFAFSENTLTADELAKAVTALQSTQEELSAANATTQAAIIQTAFALATGQISTEDFDAAVANLMVTQDAQTAATGENTGATGENTGAKDENTGSTEALTGALDAETVATMAASVESEILAARQEELMSAAEAAAGGQASAEAAAASLAVQFGIAYSEALRLIGALRTLGGIKGPGTGAASGALGGALGGVGRQGPGGSGKGAQSGATTDPRAIAAQIEAEAAAAAAGRGGGRGRGRGSGGGGGGASKAEKEAEKQRKAAEAGAAKLVEIQENAAEKIAEINAATAEKLVEIDRKAAEERARIAQELADDIVRTQNAAAAEAEVNDLDLVGKDISKEEMARLKAREQAEQEAADRRAEAAKQAQEEIANGNAEAAQAEYEQQQRYIDERQQLDQTYYEKQAELAGNPEALAELERQYQEAIAALEKQRDDEIAIQQAAIDAKAQQREAEKAQVIADAQEQKDKVVAAAVEQAEKVKGASDAQRQAVADALAAQAQAATDWAAATEAAASRVAEAYADAAAAAASLPAPPTSGGDSGGSSAGSGGGGTAAAGGGTFMTSGPTKLTVGDNPGGVEMVTVTPISGRGSTRVGTGMARMAGGGSLLAGLDLGAMAGSVSPETLDGLQRAVEGLRNISGLLDSVRRLADVQPLASPLPLDALRGAIAEANAALSTLQQGLVPISEEQEAAIGRYLDAVGGAIDLVAEVNDLAATMADPAPPLDPAAVARLAAEARRVFDALDGEVLPLAETTVEDLSRYADAVGSSVDILMAAADLARETAALPPPLNVRGLEELARGSAQAARIVQAVLLPMAIKDSVTLERYGQAVADSVAVLLDLADLRQQLGAPAPALNEAYVTELARQAQRVGALVGTALVDPTEAGAALFARYAEAVASSVAVLRDTQALRQELGAPAPALNEPYVIELAMQAQRVAQIVGRNLMRYTADTQQVFQEYRDTVGAAVSVLADTASLRADLDGAKPPIDEAYVIGLAQEAARVSAIVSRNLFRFVADTRQAFGEYAEVVTSAVSILRDVAGLRADAEAAKTPLSGELVTRLADEARAVALIVNQRLVRLSEAQAADLARYAEASGAAISVLRDVAALRADTADLSPPISLATMTALADEAKAVAAVVRARLLPTTEDQAADLERYARAAQGSVQILSAVAGLREAAADLGPPISDRTLQTLAADARRATATIRSTLIPLSEAQAAEVERYTSAVSSSTSALASVADLSATLFRDYVSPSDSQLALLSRDAQRLVKALQAGATVLGTEGATQAQAYADALTATFTATREGLLSFQAINDQTFALDPKKLAQFQASTTALLGVTRALGAQAAGIPSQDLAALQGVAGAVSSVADSYVRLAAVPFDNLGSLTANLAGAGGGGSAAGPITITINAAAGQSPQQIADAVIARLNAATTSRR